ncbi:hypothetical protein QAD02_003453 [Eretmocerus hayati]|uniref:Uncharacterized protein n=1 Tax=Eretmocerus hayati TaxID=131215 RepID=A0ACC2NMB8_9HYME|nr:hypothetical protein QAD02_003453 [Eretmocerus hayati]
MLRTIEDAGLLTLNRNFTGDEGGNYTYTRTRGNTVIDYAISNLERLEKIKEMKFGQRTKSDHMPLEITLSASTRTDLKNRINQVTTTRIIEEKDTGSQNWWDKECWKKEEEVLELFQKAREDEVRGTEYYVKRKEYRKLIQRKKRKKQKSR